jgi:microcystin-dependent protein
LLLKESTQAQPDPDASQAGDVGAPAWSHLMTTPFLGEIQIFGFNFAPRTWATANGATVSIQQYAALFSLLGTQYGGNGTTTFQLPNLIGRAACNQGTGPGLTPRIVGETFGEFNVALNTQTIPAHSHTMIANEPPVPAVPAPVAGAAWAKFAGTAALVGNNPPATVSLNPAAVNPTGGNVPHPNQQPYLALNFCIALNGAFPSFG